MKKLYNKVKKALLKKHKIVAKDQKERFQKKIEKNKVYRKNFPIKHIKDQEAHDKPQSMEQLLLQEKSSTSNSEDINAKKGRFQKIKEKIRSFKTKKAKSLNLRKGISKSVFKKLLKEEIKNFNSSKVKKNKIIDSKRLAFLLTAGTIIAVLPTFSLAPLPALAITSACIFSINLVAVKTLKKVIKQRKLAAELKTLAKPKTDIQDISAQPAKEKLQRW